MKIRSALVVTMFVGLMAFGDWNCPWIPEPDPCGRNISFDGALKADPC
jgi:hypothetical protein